MDAESHVYTEFAVEPHVETAKQQALDPAATSSVDGEHLSASHVGVSFLFLSFLSFLSSSVPKSRRIGSAFLCKNVELL